MAGRQTPQEGNGARASCARLLSVFCLLALAPDSAWGADAAEVPPGAQGLTGVTQVNPGAEVQIYSVELDVPAPAGHTDELGFVGNLGLRITISDLSIPTGISAADFSQMRLYVSTDAILDGGDIQMTFTAPVVVGIATFTELDATGAPMAQRLIPDAPASTFFLASVVLSGTATPGHAFRVSAAAPHIGIDETGGILPTPGAIGSLIGPSDGNSIVIGFSGAKAKGSGTVPIPFGGETAILFLLLISTAYMLRRRGY